MEPFHRMTFQETIDYLYRLLPVFHREGKKAFKADLMNTLRLCEYLGNPQTKFKSIHVAGTNGKGSTSHMMAAILQTAGYKTGLYTSPHLKSYTERFRINGLAIPEQRIVSFVEQHQVFIEELKPSFFELSVALAFEYFAENKVDIAVIEVGLGGRLDSTNVIMPELSMITNIGWDHMDILGNSLESIASEKAGIFKQKIPVVVSEKQEDTISSVFVERANELNSPIFFATDSLSVKEVSTNFNEMIVDVFDGNTLIYRGVTMQLSGKYQLKNILGVLKSIHVLNSIGYKITESDIRYGLANTISLTGLKGRWQILKNSPLTICDTAHNIDGLREVLGALVSLAKKNYYFILGFVKDKDILPILTLFPKDAFYYFCEANSPRALPAEELNAVAKTIGLEGKAIANVNDAIQIVTKQVGEEDIVFVGGSNFIVAEIDNL